MPMIYTVELPKAFCRLQIVANTLPIVMLATFVRQRWGGGYIYKEKCLGVRKSFLHLWRRFPTSYDKSFIKTVPGALDSYVIGQ